LKKLALAAALLLFICQPALAKELRGWGATTWGMPEQEVLRLLKDDIASTEEINIAPINGFFDKRINLKQQEIAGLPMTVSFFLQDDKLIRTSLAVDKNKASAYNFTTLKTLLIKKYGSLDSKNRHSFSDWAVEKHTWLKRLTTIELILYTGSKKRIIISYSPTPDAGGL
jgi:hypothetical protein